MNKIMWSNILVQKNITTLKEAGFHILGPVNGEQACGDVGMGRMIECSEIISYLKNFNNDHQIAKILIGKKIIITAGPTREKIDPVRFLSNYSSGKMGYAIAKAAQGMGANVILISGPTSLPVPYGIQVNYVESASEMLEAIEKEIHDADIYIGVAAVVDYKAERIEAQKIKKDYESTVINLTKNIDIIKYLKEKYHDIFCVGFAAETNNILEYGYEKLKEKSLDMIAINDVSDNKAFGSDYNELLVLTKDEQSFHLQKSTKDQIALRLLEIISNTIDL